jgi:predicted O-linked N-acetylglucosamine transferase (SPINDLY family)
MGVPVLTKKGNWFIAHNGETIARNSGQSNWIAQDEGDYLEKAINYSSDLIALARLRAGLRRQILGSPLFDAPRFARNFEQVMDDIWRDYVNRSS